MNLKSHKKNSSVRVW